MSVASDMRKLTHLRMMVNTVSKCVHAWLTSIILLCYDTLFFWQASGPVFISHTT